MSGYGHGGFQTEKQEEYAALALAGLCIVVFA